MSEPITSFWGEYRFLSNFARVSVTYEGLTYPSVENAYQAARCVQSRDRVKLVNLTPGRAKRRASRFDAKPDWTSQRETVMLDLLRQKFRQPPYRQLLLATGSRPLIEGNAWGDTYWGVCDDVGLNRLGILLMQVRSELFGEDADSDDS